MWNQVSRTFVARISQSKEKFEDNENIFNSKQNELSTLCNVKRNRCLLQKFKQISTWQSLKETYQLHALYRPRFHKNYFYGYPLFNNCISANMQKCLIFRSGKIDQISQKINHILIGVAHPQKQSWSSCESYLITTNELDALIIVHNNLNPNLTNSLNISERRNSWSSDVNNCNCELCVNRQNAILSSVLKAKCFVDETVSASNVCQSLSFVDFSFYMINLFLITACLRGML